MNHALATVTLTRAVLCLALLASCYRRDNPVAGKTIPCPKTLCGQACVDPASDRENCGGCGKACEPGLVCSVGVCALDCAGGSMMCGDACVDTRVDPTNCGECGNVCDADLVCAGGTCALKCAGNSEKCGRACVDIRVDRANCGACESACAPGMV